MHLFSWSLTFHFHHFLQLALIFFNFQKTEMRFSYGKNFQVKWKLLLFFLIMKILRWGELVYVKQKLLVLYLSRGLKFIYFKANLLYYLHVLFTYLSLTFVMNVILIIWTKSGFHISHIYNPTILNNIIRVCLCNFVRIFIVWCIWIIIHISI